jgi:hypothetical protein
MLCFKTLTTANLGSMPTSVVFFLPHSLSFIMLRNCPKKRPLEHHVMKIVVVI